MTCFRFRRATSDAIARAAKRQGITQKQVVCFALQAAGLAVAPIDLTDGKLRRGNRTVRPPSPHP